MKTRRKGVVEKRSGGKPKARKRYTRTVAMTARQCGWDGVRNVTLRELCLLAGVGYDQLRLDRVEHGLLGEPLPKKSGVRTPIWGATAAKRYLRNKNPEALDF